MGVDIKEDFLQKEEWINNIKFMSPRPRYNHIELQGYIYVCSLRNILRRGVMFQ